MDNLINRNPEGAINSSIKKPHTATNTRYAIDPAYREKMKAYMRAKYRATHPLKEKAHQPPKEPKEPKMTRKERYATDEAYRENIKEKVRERYYVKKNEVELDLNTLKLKIEKLLKLIIILL